MKLSPTMPEDRPRGRPSGGPARRFAVLVLALAAGPGAGAAQLPPPDVEWYTFDTPHFQVVYHEGLGEVAARAAERGERAIENLTGFGTPPELPIQMLVTDHVDLSNGFATAIPYPRIVLWARPPIGGLAPIPFDDWMELLVTHEVVHILHAEMAGPVGRVARGMFGRAPFVWPFFPAFTLPSWALEGVAVQAESALTDGGRIHGARLEGTVRAAALEGRLERIDQAIGVSGVHPGGDRPYVYGALFHEFLAQRHGDEALARFFRRQTERLNPYRLDATAEEAFGRSLSGLHAEWRARVTEEAVGRRAEVRGRSLAPEPRILTRNTRAAAHPRFEPGTGALLYARSDGRSEPALVRRDPHCEDAPDTACREEVVQALHVVGPLSPRAGGGVILAQPDFVDRYRIRSDLWWIGPEGEKRVLTRGLRVAAVDARSEDGWMVAAIEFEGTHRLVLLDEAGAEVRELAPPDPGILWGNPRWSPEGARIAIPRWRAGGSWEIVILDSEGGERGVAEQGRAPAGGPAWSPDGRWLVWSSERTGVANLFAAPVDARGTPGVVRQLSDLVTGGAFPEVDPTGRRLLFSLISGDGWGLAELPFRPEAGFEPLPPDPRFSASEPGRMATRHPDRFEAEPRPWSPLPTLRPRYWFPHAVGAESLGGVRVLPTAVGVHTGATDLVGRHRWEARVALPAGGEVPRREARAVWEWAGLGNPVLTGTVEQRWDALGRVRVVPAEGAAEAGRDLLLLARERSVGVRAEAFRPGFRGSRSAAVDLRGIRQARTFLEPDGSAVETGPLPPLDRDLVEGALTLGWNRARSYPLSLGPQEGVSVATRFRVRREAGLPAGARGVRGRDAGYRDGVGVFRAFRPLPWGTKAEGPPVLSLRLAGGLAGGVGAGSGHFGVGGTGDRLFPVRGVEGGTRSGTRAWSATAEVRAPLVRLHRGWGILPLHLDQLAASVFVDTGAAPAGGLDPSVLASAGIEFALQQTVLYRETDRIRVGVAFPFAGERGAAVHLSTGWAF